MNRANAILLLSVLALGCSGVDVKRDYDTSVDFGRLKTYAWQPPAPQETGGDLANNSLLDARVRAGVNAALSEKGFKKASPGDADCLIAYHYAVDKEPAQDQVRSGIGLGMGSGGAFGSLGIGLGSEGGIEERETLTIDVLDPRSGKLFWRGSTQQRLENSSNPRKAAARLNATAHGILAKFPPNTNR